MSVSISGKVESESLSLGEGEGDVKELKGDVCTVYDLKFWEEVLRSEKQLSPSVTRFQNHPYFDLFIFQNVSISSKNTKVPVNKAQWTGGTPAGTPEFIDSKLSFEVADESLSFPMGSPHVQSGFLGSVSGIGKNKLEQKCQVWFWFFGFFWLFSFFFFSFLLFSSLFSFLLSSLFFSLFFLSSLFFSLLFSFFFSPSLPSPSNK